MPAAAAYFGFMPINHSSGVSRPRAYTILTNYNTNIFKGDPVKWVADGSINLAAAGDTMLGVFAGCEFTNAAGQRILSPYWPASALTTNTDIVAYVWDDPRTQFKVQSNQAHAQLSVGDHVDHVAGTGSTITGQSGAYVANAPAGPTVAGWRIMGLYKSPDNAFTDSFPILTVEINEHYLGASTAAV